METWRDLYDLFGKLFRPDPLADYQGPQAAQGVGMTTPDLLDLRTDPSGLSLAGRDSTALADMQSWADRRARYREYERLRGAIPEIENILTVVADEACVVGQTPVATPYGMLPIRELAEARKHGERFLVYSFDFAAGDYTLAWAHSPRPTGTKPTVRVVLDDGSTLQATPDHRVLLRDATWRAAGDLKHGDEVMPFYRVRPRNTGLKANQFPRIRTLKDGWKHERQLMDEWRLGRGLPRYERIAKAIRLICQGLDTTQIPMLMDTTWRTIDTSLQKEGFTYTEVKRLSHMPDRRRVINVHADADAEVFDLSVDVHENFATDSCIVHNCQSDDKGHVVHVTCEDDWIQDESEYVIRDQWELDDEAYGEFKNLCLYGDHFHECVINPNMPEMGILKLETLPAESMFRMETVRGDILEYQQSRDMPNYDNLQGRMPWGEADRLNSNGPTRFDPNQIIHVRLGERRRKFYPYGISALEPARTPAHMLRLLEDSMLVYRLSRAPERRVFYIDVQNLPGWKAESVIDRIRDQFRKKKVPNALGGVGASSLEERWHPPAVDEDFFLPVRGSNSSTKIETLQGGQNLGEIDDALYFRRKLYVSMNMPPKFGMEEDVQQTRVTLSSRDMQFARFVERLQKPYAKGIKEALVRHFTLRGVAQERLRTLKVFLTPPSDWRRLSRQEVTDALFNRAVSIKGAQFISDYDIFRDVLGLDERTSQDYVARMKQQKLEDLRLTVMGQNPGLLNLGTEDEAIKKEIGVDASGPSERLPPPEEGQGQQAAPPGGEEAGPSAPPAVPEGQQPPIEGTPITEPTREDIVKYDLRIRIADESRSDDEEVDRSSLGEV